ncbi:MAG: antibiotic biosynthesis monooxygenase [Pyrinomonadaceae bacterium]
MVKKALFARLKAKEGKEAELEAFLNGGLELAEGEPLTVHWFALKFDDSTFGIFDTFEGDEGRDAHLNGRIAAALMAKKEELLSEDPSIEKVELLAAKT